MEHYGRYILLKRLAVGGMAEVFLAFPQNGRAREEDRLVIKRILPNLAADAHFVTMFLNEARVAARLNHPNIVRLFDLGKEGESYFLAMEFIHGDDLGALVNRLAARDQRLPLPQALRLIRDACLGLSHAHTLTDERGAPLHLVHRDISPQNVMVSFDGEVKLLDFGIARASNLTSTTQTGEIKGKYAYIAPEQARGSGVDQRSDLFSLGLVLYELLTGHSPFKRGNDLITLRAAIECAIEPPSRFVPLPHALEAIVLKAVARDPRARFASASAFARAIERFLPECASQSTREALARTMRQLFAAEFKVGLGQQPASARFGDGAERVLSPVRHDTAVVHPIEARASQEESSTWSAWGQARSRRSPASQPVRDDAARLDDEESTVSSRLSPLSRPRAADSFARDDSLEARLDALRDASSAAVGDDEETQVTESLSARVHSGVNAVSTSRRSNAFLRPRLSQGTTQEEDPFDAPAPMPHELIARLNRPSPPHASMPRARAGEVPAERPSRTHSRQEDGRAGRVYPPGDEEGLAEETRVDIEALPTAPQDDEDEETTTESAQRPRPSPWSSQSATRRPSREESSPLWTNHLDGDNWPRTGESSLDEDEDTATSTVNSRRSAPRTLPTSGVGGRVDSSSRERAASFRTPTRPRPRPLVSAEVELVDDRDRRPTREMARPVRPVAARGSLADRLEEMGSADEGGPLNASREGLGGARLPELRARTRFLHAVQRVSIIADRFDEFRLRVGISRGALGMALFLTLIFTLFLSALLLSD